MRSIFWGSLLLLFYIYLGYPALVRLLGWWRPKPIRRQEATPRVSVLIAAYNEESCIEATVRNKLALDYPPDRLEVLVVSDGCTDGTEEAVLRVADSRLRLLRQSSRMGKTAALNLAARQATGDILVFADANSLYRPEALRRLMRNFADPQVGYVTGRMIYQTGGTTATGEGCGLYMRYENALREAETAIGSVVGVDGGIDAVRRELYREMRPDQLPDFVLPLSVVERRCRVVYEKEAILTEAALDDSADEYRMRVRVALRALWALKEMRQLLSCRRFPLFAWQLWSHKVLRYFAFPFILAAWVAGGLLWSAGWPYRLLFLLQSAGYLAATLNYLGRLPRLRLGRVSLYFVLVNLAAAHAFLKFACGRRQVLWTPRKG